MDKVDRLIKEYLKTDSALGIADRGFDCPSEQILLGYLHGQIDEEKRQLIEQHIAGCGFCLSQLAIAYQSFRDAKQGGFKPVPKKLINKTKLSLGIYKKEENGNGNNKMRIIKKRLFLAGAIIFFALSFIIPKYFIQFLVATLILGIRWAFESESGRTLIMVLDSWRHHSQDKDEEISHRLKKHL